MSDSVNFQFQLPSGLGEMLLRIGMIVFAALGIVYIFGRLLPNKLKDRGKNILAVFALLIISIMATVAFNPMILDMNLEDMALSQIYFYLWETFLYFSISAVFYVTIGWRFYSRMDALLDHKIGKDDRRRQ